MTVEVQDKLAQSQDRLNEAVRKIFEQNPKFTGQIHLEIHVKDGIIRGIYEIRGRKRLFEAGGRKV